MTISVIIPNYNGREILEKNLPLVIKNCRGAEIILVDDASTDDSCNLVRQKYPGIKLIIKKENTGFSSTVNLGVQYAKGDLVVLLNSDVYPKKEFLKVVLPHFDSKDVFAVGLLQESIENGKIVLRGRGKAEFKRGFLIHQRGEADKTDTFWVSGGAGVFRKSIWETLGGLNEIYDPFYWEDIDLCYRALKSGYRIIFEPKSTVVHEQEVSSIRSKYTKGIIKQIAYRNQFYFVWLNISDCLFLCQHLIFLPFHLARSIFSADVEFFRGFCSAAVNLPQVVKFRHFSRNLWKNGDKHIFKSFMVK